MRFYGDDTGSDTTAIVAQAIDRYRAAALAAQMACDTRSANPLQTIFEWATGNTYTGSICDRAAQMKINVDEYSARLADPNTTPEQRREILGFVQKETNVQDLIDLYNASSAADILKNAADPRNVLPTMAGFIPWWVYGIGALAAANALGIFRRKGT